MNLKQQVKLVSDKLLNNGWFDELCQALYGNLNPVNRNQFPTMGNNADQVITKLTSALSAFTNNVAAIDGLNDMHPDADRLIRAGDPARSILYHAVASSGFQPFLDETKYLDLADIITLENFVFVAGDADANLVPRDPVTLKQRAAQLTGIPIQDVELGVVVFALEYRQGYQTIHRNHADLCFSRTGLSRVGNKSAQFSKKNRGYWPHLPGDGDHDIRVTPTRYAPFVAVKVPGSRANPNSFGPLPPVPGGRLTREDQRSEFWIPLHKLFSGAQNECIAGHAIQVDLEAHHVNAKLRALHVELNSELSPKAHPTGRTSTAVDLEQAPFYVTDGELVDQSFAQGVNANGEVVPRARQIVQQAADQNGRKVTFKLPQRLQNAGSARVGDYDIFMFGSSLGLRHKDHGFKTVPEFLHIRAKLNRNNPNSPIDLNDNDRMHLGSTGNSENDSNDILVNTDRRHHYQDFTGDGWVTVRLGVGVPQILKDNVRNAYSVIAAPDFYPGVNQYDVSVWERRRSDNGSNPIWNRDPDELSADRLKPNPLLKANLAGSPVAAGGNPVFKHDEDKTCTAIVGLLTEVASNTSRPHDYDIDDYVRNNKKLPEINVCSTLPDAGSGIFQPGWDISQMDAEHFGAHGLGSPFPEDAKLCAALSGFWPAVAPDTTRVFLRDHQRGRRIVIPMEDKEITGSQAWDGIQGPTLFGNQSQVMYPDIFYADYSINAEKNQFSLAATAQINLVEYVGRVRSYQIAKDQVQRNKVLVSFTASPNGMHKFVFATLANMQRNNDHRFFNNSVSRHETITVHHGRIVNEVHSAADRFSEESIFSL